jgi:hypothetical protein
LSKNLFYFGENGDFEEELAPLKTHLSSILVFLDELAISY